MCGVHYYLLQSLFVPIEFDDKAIVSALELLKIHVVVVVHCESYFLDLMDLFS